MPSKRGIAMHSLVIVDINLLLNNDPDYEALKADTVRLEVTFADETTERWDVLQSAFRNLLDVAREVAPKSGTQ